MIKKRVSIKDIAELAGVSHPTVSRALRGQGRMSERTRAKIIAVAEEIGYTPSLVARGLVMQRSFCIGLIVPTFVNLFNSAVAQGIELEARKQGYSLFLASTDAEAAREMEVMRSFLARQVDGIIAVSGYVGDEYARALSTTGVPIVLINVNAENSSVHSIYHDDYSGGCKITKHLTEQGYQRIAYIGASKEGRSHIERRRAWHDTLVEAGLTTVLEIDSLDGNIECGATACQQILSKCRGEGIPPPDALCCFNDLTAIGAMSTLRKNDFRIPDDIAITGFDDIELAGVTEPPLTTIRQPLQAMGTKAMSLLIDLMDPTVPEVEAPHLSSLSGELIIREST